MNAPMTPEELRERQEEMRNRMLAPHIEDATAHLTESISVLQKRYVASHGLRNATTILRTALFSHMPAAAEQE